MKTKRIWLKSVSVELETFFTFCEITIHEMSSEVFSFPITMKCLLNFIHFPFFNWLEDLRKQTLGHCSS
jgi:hypothetical protein